MTLEAQSDNTSVLDRTPVAVWAEDQSMFGCTPAAPAEDTSGLERTPVAVRAEVQSVLDVTCEATSVEDPPATQTENQSMLDNL